MSPLTQDEKSLYRFITTYITDLYVMQNEFGLIKIGQSVNPEERRLALQVEERCQIKLVLALSEKGNREKAIHRKVKDFNVGGEWFDGTKESQQAILKAIKPGLSLDWPYELNNKAADDWLEAFYDRREIRYRNRNVDECLRTIRRLNEPNWIVDSAIWEALMHIEDRFIGVLVGEHDADGFPSLDGFVADNDTPIRIPRYSSSLEDAMLLWPEDIRPISWEGTPIECCLAAILVRRKRWKSNE